MDSLNGEEKKDASKEDLEQEEGESNNLSNFAEFFEYLKREIDKRQIRRRFFIIERFKLIVITETTSTQI